MNTNIAVVELDDDTLSGDPELWVIVQSDEIVDRHDAMAWVDENHPDLWKTWDRDSWMFSLDWDRFLATRAEGYRFHDEWVFTRKAS